MPHVETRDGAHYLDGTLLKPGEQIQWWEGKRWSTGRYERAPDDSAWFLTGGFGRRLQVGDEVRSVENKQGAQDG